MANRLPIFASNPRQLKQPTKALHLIRNIETPTEEIPTSSRSDIEKAYEACKRLSRSHYENFPVGSLFTPKEYRPFIHSIYAFARGADDLADEGAGLPEERLRNLEHWQSLLDECFSGRATHPTFIALSETVRCLGLPKKPFDDLLVAFRMDVTTRRFRTFEDLLFYCRHSANPIGQLVLHVFGSATSQTLSCSDQLCTALQLANFWQDVSVDLLKGRIYLPLEDFDRFGYTEAQLLKRADDQHFRRLIEFQLDRTRQMFNLAKPILTSVTPTLRFELALTWNGGMTILKKIEQARYGVLSRRPVITSTDKLRILWHSLLRGPS